jgi:hypothetical protein
MFWTPAFAGVTLQDAFYETIVSVTLYKIIIFKGYDTMEKICRHFRKNNFKRLKPKDKIRIQILLQFFG